MKVDVCRDPALTTVPVLRVRACGFVLFAWGVWRRTGQWSDRPRLPGVVFERDWKALEDREATR